jgi:hypothetical protein
VVLTAATLCAVPLDAQVPDTVTLRSGSTVIGEVELLKRGSLSVTTDEMGTVKIDWEIVEDFSVGLNVTERYDSAPGRRRHRGATTSTRSSSGGAGAEAGDAHRAWARDAPAPAGRRSRTRSPYGTETTGQFTSAAPATSCVAASALVRSSTESKSALS